MGSNGKLFLKLQKEVDRLTAEFGQQDFWLVLEGDWGGQIYFTIPWRAVTRRARIKTFLSQLDRLAWGCNGDNGSSARIYWMDAKHREMERRCGGPCGVPGGMGGGDLWEDRPWLHSLFFGQPDSLEQEEFYVEQGIVDLETATKYWIDRVAKIFHVCYVSDESSQ